MRVYHICWPLVQLAFTTIIISKWWFYRRCTISADRWYSWQDSSPLMTQNCARQWQGGNTIFGTSATVQTSLYFLSSTCWTSCSHLHSEPPEFSLFPWQTSMGNKYKLVPSLPIQMHISCSISYSYLHLSPNVTPPLDPAGELLTKSWNQLTWRVPSAHDNAAWIRTVAHQVDDLFQLIHTLTRVVCVHVLVFCTAVAPLKPIHWAKVTWKV